MKPRSLILFVLLACASIAQGQSLGPVAMREDLLYLRDVWSRTDRSLDAQRREAFERIVDQALARTDRLGPAEFAIEVARAVAVAGNGHSEADIAPFLHGMPVGFAWFADGLFIVRAEETQRHLLGAAVRKLGRLTPEEARARVAPLIPGNEARIRSASAVWLRKLEVLQYIGASRDAKSAMLELELRDGRRQRVTLGPERGADPSRLPEWSGVTPAPRDLPGRWAHVLDSAAQVPAVYGARTNLERQWWRDDQVVYLRSNYVWGTKENRYELFEKLIGVMQVEVAERRPKYAIVDLRLNHGGDLFNTLLFAQALPRLIPPDGRIYVLVGPDTFSAAIVTAAVLEDSGGARVVLAGDTMGDFAEFWSEGRDLELPHSRIAVSTAMRKHNWEKACSDSDCYWANAAYGPRGISLEPTLRVPLRFADYAAGRDPLLETVLSDAR